MADTILFDKLPTLTVSSAPASMTIRRAHAEAMDEALRESVVTKADLRSEITRLETKIDLAVRDMTIRTGAMLIALFAALASIKFFG
jgi:hypothetical protein